MIKIFIVDDHQIVRDGLRALIQRELDMKIIGEAASYEELEKNIQIEEPDIMLLDISLPDISGIEITKIYKLKYPNIRIIILSMYMNEEFILGAVHEGVYGYLPKNTTRKELIDAIRKVNEFNQYFPPEISSIIVKQYVKKSKMESTPENKLSLLSIRETEILKLYSEGYSNKEIADKLFISIRTVESHKNHIMQKLELKSNVDLVKFAIKNNIVLL
jgi:DNA-binding NarL/FixJ family response regulator